VEIFNRTQPKLAVYSHIVWGGNNTEQDLINLTREKYSGPLVVGQKLMQIKIGKTVEVVK